MKFINCLKNQSVNCLLVTTASVSEVNRHASLPQNYELFASIQIPQLSCLDKVKQLVFTQLLRYQSGNNNSQDRIFVEIDEAQLIALFKLTEELIAPPEPAQPVQPPLHNLKLEPQKDCQSLVQQKLLITPAPKMKAHQNKITVAPLSKQLLTVKCKKSKLQPSQHEEQLKTAICEKSKFQPSLL